MRVVLVNPAKAEDIQQFRWGIGHLGLAYIAAVLEQRGTECRVIDGKAEKLTPEVTAKRVCDLRPDIAGLTAMTHEIHLAHDIAEKIKAKSPSTTIVVGGPHATALPERTLAEFPSFDIVISGEGENSMVDIVNTLNSGNNGWGDIKGITFRENGDIHRNEPRPFLTSEELDELPFPAWHLFPDQGFPIYAGRGCPYRCKFCMRVLGNRVRMRSPEKVIAEIEYLYLRFNKKSSWFQDETFGLSRKWTSKFLDLLEDFRAKYNMDWWWKVNSRVNLANYDTYKRMHELGCRGLDFGIESGNQEILKSIQKGITLKNAIDAIRVARKAGMVTEAFFIIGHPNETFKTAMDTIRFAAKLNSDRIAVGVMVPYPGTEIWSLAKNGDGGYELLSEDWRLYDKYFGEALRMRHLSTNQLKLLQSLCYFWFYLRNFRIKELYKFISSHFKESLLMAGILLGLRKKAT